MLAPPDELGLVRSVDGLGHGVVVGVADRAGRWQHAELPDPGGVHEADVLDSVIAVVHEPLGAAMVGDPGYGLLQRLLFMFNVFPTGSAAFSRSVGSWFPT